MKKNKLIFNKFIENRQIVFNYLDIGARGDIAKPWNLFDPKRLKVIGFEPDPIEAERLVNKYPDRKYYPHALWGECTERKFYLNKWSSTSSMYPPNEDFNRQFEKKHWVGRTIEKELMIKCVTLDSIIQPEDTPDFIKIDTQGSEYEILKGAQSLLMNYAPLVLTETWCAEIYKGIPLSHEIMRYMYKLGYQVFDINIAAAWKHSNKSSVNITSKPKTIGFDFLFIKRAEEIRSLNSEQYIKLIALCEFYGFRDYSLNLIENATNLTSDLVENIRHILLENNRNENKLSEKIKRKIKRMIYLRSQQYPSLH